MLTRKGQDLLAVFALMAILALASTLEMIRIGVSQQSVDPALNPSPLGYTFSLALFVIPCVVFGVWLWRSLGGWSNGVCASSRCSSTFPWGSSFKRITT
jgi:hypothetical protein